MGAARTICAIEISCESDWLDVQFRGWDALMCLKSHLVVPYAVITDVSVRSFDAVRPELGWRVGGAYWPGLIATGHYTRPGRPGERQFWRVYRSRDRLLVLETSWSSPSRIVLSVPDVDHVVAELRRHVPVSPT